MDFGISGRCALVTAGGGGLGSATAMALAREGARVAVADLAEDRALEVATRIAENGGVARGYVCDLGIGDSIDALVERVRADLGDPGILVNITGGPPPTAALGVSASTWSAQFNSLVLGVIHLADVVVPVMASAGWGRVITSTSSGVVAPIANLALSNSLRLSLVGWSKSLANEVGRYGVTVNVVVPGRIDTGRVRELDEARAKREARPIDDVRRASTAGIPLQRYGEPSEFAAAVTFLAGSPASYMTGSVVRVDGGLIASI